MVGTGVYRVGVLFRKVTTLVASCTVLAGEAVLLMGTGDFE